MVFPNHERMLKQSRRAVPPMFIQDIARDPVPFCHRITGRINTLFRELGNHPVYLRDLLWLAGHLRILASGSSPALGQVARAIHYFLEEPADRAEFNADLRWLCLEAIGAMIADFGPQVRRNYISKEEKDRVEELWLSCFPKAPHEPGLEGLKQGAEDYAKRLEKLSNEIHLPDISQKIRFLIERCDDSSEESQWARAALKYLLIERDILPDSWGYLGLLDDVTVVEQTCEMIDEHALWHPLLEHFLNQWPFLREISFAEESRLERLSAFLKLAGGITLDRLHHPGSQSCLVVSQRGPLALLGALFAYLSVQADQPKSQRNLPKLEIGDPIELWSPVQKVKACFEGFDEQTGMKLKVATSRRAGSNPYLDVWLMPPYFRFLSKVSRPHPCLSTHSDFNQWKKSVQPDLMAALLGHRAQPLKNPPLLLIMRRNKLQKLLENCRPMGQSMKNLLGITYITRRGKFEQWSCGRYNVPQLLVCSEPLIARQLLEGRLKIDFDELPRFLLVDGPALLPDDRHRWQAKPATLIFAEVAEREAIDELQRKQFHVDYLTAEDTIWPHEPVGKFEGEANYLLSYMWRQHLAPHVFHHTEEVAQPLLATIHNCLEEIRHRLGPDDDGLDVAVEVFAFLRRAEKHLLRPNNKERAALREMLDQALDRVAAGRVYHSSMHDLWVGLTRLVEAWSAWPFDREQALRHQLLQLPRDGRQIGILSPKRFLGKVRQTLCEQGGHVIALSFEMLETAPPLHTLILPFWPGRTVLRRLQSNGFAAECIYLFFPHERRWLNHLRMANDRYHQQLRSDVRKQWRLWQQSYDLPDLRPVAPRDNLGETLIESPEEAGKGSSDESADFDAWLQRHTQKHVQQLVSGQGAKTTAAHFVLFESPLYFFFAAPKSRTLCVNDLLECREDEDSSSNPKYLRPFNHILVGDVLAFPMEDREDVIDDLADRFLEDSKKLRRTASLWRDALRRCHEALNWDFEVLQQHLAKHGLERGLPTIRHWLGRGHVVAPRGQKDLALILQITGDAELKKDFRRVRAAVDDIYRARRLACKHFLRQIKDVDLDVDQEIVEIEIAGKEFHFRVLQVAKILPRQEIPYQLVGRLQYGRQVLKHEDQDERSEEVGFE